MTKREHKQLALDLTKSVAESFNIACEEMTGNECFRTLVAMSATIIAVFGSQSKCPNCTTKDIIAAIDFEVTKFALPHTCDPEENADA